MVVRLMRVYRCRRRIARRRRRLCRQRAPDQGQRSAEPGLSAFGPGLRAGQRRMMGRRTPAPVWRVRARGRRARTRGPEASRTRCRLRRRSPDVPVPARRSARQPGPGPVARRSARRPRCRPPSRCRRPPETVRRELVPLAASSCVSALAAWESGADGPRRPALSRLRRPTPPRPRSPHAEDHPRPGRRRRPRGRCWTLFPPANELACAQPTLPGAASVASVRIRCFRC